MQKSNLLELSADQVYAPCTLKDRELFSPKKGQKIIGQEDALKAIDFGIRMSASGYNIFCIGPKGVGRTSLSIETVKKYAQTQPTPDDWCFIHNFDIPHQPTALHFPAGQGAIFEKDVRELAEILKKKLMLLFTEESYHIQASHIEQKYRAQKEEYFKTLKKSLDGAFVTLSRTDDGISVAPVRNKTILAPEEFNALPKSERKKMMLQMQAAQKKLENLLKKIPAFETAERKEIENLSTSLAIETMDAILKLYLKKYANHSGVLTFFNGFKKSILDNLSLLMPDDENVDDNTFDKTEILWSRFAVNLIVSHKPDEGAPVIHVNHPTLTNLIGKIERLQLQGTSTTDFSLIRPGALHIANGGYLVVEASDLLENQPTWSALKRCLFSRTIKMESGIDDNSIFGVISQDPSPIPLSLKVILIGEPSLYYSLAEQDDEFSQLFKIQSRFAEKMDRTKENEKAYAHLLSNLVVKEKMLPFTANAIRRTIEQSSRWACDQKKLSTYLVHANDLMREANYLALQKKEKHVDTPYIEMALSERRKRFGVDQRELMDTIKRGMIAIDTTGQKVGQINALVVYDFGMYSFGKPSRITCQVHLGRGQLVDIEREVRLGGPIHSKGVMILSSFLSARFAQEKPISLNASLVFEQSYSEVDGDSASVAELVCLLSAIGNIPINQSLAVTGSVNQLGEVQAIGAVNEKIEGFFETCKAKGLTGNQGVVIPATIIQHLVLNPEVVSAIETGKFHIYAVRTIDEAMSILTGKSVSEINHSVQSRLNDFYAQARKTLLPNSSLK